ncbi:TPR domain-containing protein [Vibrio methylphosphonaticus]|uniref:TPR domain-containing protein n=1 Tax=Vibrio methylphosphonaticus TaxID=2946866 RepID=UPI00202A70D8|nr:tetratricopeptide repeat protein [Vibrio methylphosphonaticus]MCL9774953.1 tetratricopeptide repeat protein [Vibrio methylphosphonaticus]
MSFALFVAFCFLMIVLVCYFGLVKPEPEGTRGRWRTFGIATALSVLVCGLSLLVWSQLKSEVPKPEKPAELRNGETMMLELQQALEQDPNNSKNWFSLGQMYMQTHEFDAAITCFDYSIRLSQNPYAGQYAAIATAKYFSESQTMTPDVLSFLDKALQMDELNDTALLLIASDHFLNARYTDAITQWTTILDSNRPGIQRADLIEKINQAKSML